MIDRRTWLAGGIGLAAAVGGAAWHLRRAAPSAGPDPAFWALRFPRPEGGELALADFRGRPLLLNFWATWCPPCVRELPLLDRFVQGQPADGWQVLALAIDGPTPVREFLRRTPLGFPIGLAGLEGTALVRQLGNEAGGLPFSIGFDRAGRPLGRHMGELDEAMLRRWADRT